MSCLGWLSSCFICKQSSPVMAAEGKTDGQSGARPLVWPAWWRSPSPICWSSEILAVMETYCCSGRGSCPTHHGNLGSPAAILIPEGEAECTSSAEGLSHCWGSCEALQTDIVWEPLKTPSMAVAFCLCHQQGKNKINKPKTNLVNFLLAVLIGRGWQSDR